MVRRLMGGPARNDRDRIAVIAEASAAAGAATGSELSYAELDRSARTVAAWLSEQCVPGDRVLLLSPLGPEIVKNFFGCLYAGVVPVVAPVPTGRDHHLARATGIAFDSGARVVLTDVGSLSPVHEWLSQDGMEELVCVATDVVELGDPGDPVDVVRGPADAAVLCYGSAVGELVATEIGYAALEQGLARTRAAFGVTADDRLLSWLPPDNYTGLMNVLTALSAGATAVLMPTRDLARDPVRWLELVDRHRVTISGGAATAFARCARAVEERLPTGLDLSCWRIAYTPSTLLDPAVLGRFADAVAPLGFDPAALRTTYCLPEATFLVSSSTPGRAPVGTRVSATALEERTLVESERPEDPVLVGAGRVERLDVRVVDPESGRELPDRRVGEVWVRGSGLARGYWGHEVESRRSFDARLDDGQDGFVRTGDLGVLDAGELYVLGRADGMLTVSGRTLRAHDVEREVAERFPGLGAHRASVFTVPVGREEVVVVQEVEHHDLDELRSLAAALRSWLRRRTRVRFGSVVFLGPGMPAIGCDRARRALMRDLFVARAAEPVYEELDADVRRRYRPPLGTARRSHVRIAV
ncbi:AMP-binding protein [Saccharothrix violaceirubra]|uniref:AMP-binding protein n=1 Tax=Saccharothrix violaceirubra TaxID=413306 RepID=UPI0028AA0CCC|nr:AMP-binding protein [Saccharothrix violaceirubra]